MMSRPDPRAHEYAAGSRTPDVIDLRTCPSCGRAREGAQWCLRCLYEFPTSPSRKPAKEWVRYEREVTYSRFKGDAVSFGIVGRTLVTALWVALVAAGVWTWSAAASGSKAWVLPAVGIVAFALAGVLGLRETWRPTRQVKVRKVIVLD